MNILKDFSVRTVHRFILYLATLIYMGSLFLPVYGKTSEVLQADMLWTMFWGVLIWPFYELLERLGEFHAEKADKGHRSSNEKAWLAFWILRFLDALYIFIVFMIVR